MSAFEDQRPDGDGYSINDLCKVTWQGDTPEQVSRFRDRWDTILVYTSTRLGDDTLRDLLLEQMSQPKEFEPEVKTCERESDRKTYELLIGLY